LAIFAESGLTACRVKENMTILCNKFFPDELTALQNGLVGVCLPACHGHKRQLEVEEAERE
jgi:hypothetical protein